MEIVLLAFFAAGIAILCWWLIFETEGVYLGRHMVVWLYDVYAHRYDDIKNQSGEFEHIFLAEPIMQDIAPHTSPLMLDVATGTGRLPLAMLSHTDFQGRVIGVDLSRRMLANAAHKFDGYQDRVTLLWCPAERLPFADNAFDVVTCLEALEFMPNPETVLRECARVLRPGGELLLTNRISTRLMPGKIWTGDEMKALLNSAAIKSIQIERWQLDYDQVWGRKSGESLPVGARPLGEVLRCPCCPDKLMIQRENEWVCEGCKGAARIADDGVIELFPLVESAC
ncbi:MAG: class I SAM-dependent methyltransferase [Burkholderiales bacterium]|nr:class I SAM-dependent methyltransferase [Anaerolineae bacterium]